MNRSNSNQFERIGIAAPTARFDVADLLRDCAELDLMDELRAALGASSAGSDTVVLRAIRDLIYELAAAHNRDLAVDALICATGIAEFGRTPLRSYARKHGMTTEGFRYHVRALQSRLHLPSRPSQNWNAN